MDSKRLTTTNIGVEELKHLKKLAEKHGLKQVEFINHCVSFFRRNGLSPASDFSPQQEIEGLKKRVDEVIRFLQVHEKQKLAPLMERLILLEHHLSENYSNTNTTSNIDIDTIVKAIRKSQQTFESNLFEMSITVHKTPQWIKEDLDYVYREQKKTIALIALLFECLKHSQSFDGLSEDHIKNFENALSEIR